ncbi:TPA: ATP-binding protein [Pseudomonas aeruginosa]|uniref:ATP-binding protein n=3 Tax=Pseudomonas aeruginosa TaxID=287 RepID=UPI0009A3B029|nr:ATP-binding protein [Pseudomonas aeruginosa]MDI4098002.1 ATP-binding protein [Pseudomonas aeruginosa]MDV2680255.1 ATP-binding protein [Pseudomonas aeruginosa]OXT72062.1 hypothetical protein CF345_05770 [Pseudomonas aeruginosa]RPO02268.1 hypothetical protein IPC1235_21145 [Pseudomonas aeruginosa]WBH90356.1 hypothetical protein PALA15_03974 [Pseudomonas aeruginosa]
MFKVKARVLLELGAELISSDGIAIYELIKNSVDARSPKIEVRINVVLTSSGYQALVSEIRQSSTTTVRRDDIFPHFNRCFEPGVSQEVRDGLMGALEGLEISKALHCLREFYCEHSYIEVEDWGDGMSLESLQSNFLTIGTPHRANERVADEGSNRDSPILGEKGIGRLSSMRLGERLFLSTTTLESSNFALLSVDWKALGENLNLDLHEFKVKATVGESKSGDKPKGTLIRISDLRSDWSLQRIVQIAKSELSKLQDPFDLDGNVLDLRISFNGKRVDVVEELDQDWLSGWHGYFDFSFFYKEINGVREPVIKGVVKFKPPQLPGQDALEVDSSEIYSAGDDLYSLLADDGQPIIKGGKENSAARFAGIQSLGPFSATGYWFNRQRKQRELPKEEYLEFKEWLTQWAGGLLVYRDGYRVYPYAGPDDDWLHLDQKALRQKSFKLNRGQFVGRVQISSRDNPNLKDQTNRQGLCDSPEQKKLVQCLQYVIWRELGALVRKYELKTATRSLSSIKEIDEKVKGSSKDAHAQLRELEKYLPGEEKTIHALRGYVEELEAAWSKAKSTIRKQQTQADVYLHLAGAGMLMEFVVHELNRMTRSTLADLNKVNFTKLPPSLQSLNAQLKTLEKRLRILDPVSTPGRQRKEGTDISQVIQVLVDAHAMQFQRHNISVTVDSSGHFLANVVQGQMYQIFENLISNSVYWLTHHYSMLLESGAGVTDFSPLIEVIINAENREVVFRDNGPGIRVTDASKVFDPFFSKKPSGRGIGLYIVKNLCAENNIAVSLVEADSRGAHAGFIFEFKGD